MKSNIKVPNVAVFPARLQKSGACHSTLPRLLRDLLSAPPKAGQGVHQWLFRTSLQLHRHRCDDEIFALLRAAVDGCGRCVPDTEIRDAIVASGKRAWEPRERRSGGRGPLETGWPSPDQERIEELLRQPFELVELWELSPTICDGGLDVDWFIDWLFPGNPLLCVGKTNSKFETARREQFRGRLGDASLIVPSPMTVTHGVTKAGRKSMHSLSNTGERYYIITEFDRGTHDEQAAILHHLGGFAPLVMVLASGGKSLHGWFHCKGVPENMVERFFRYAVSLGADSKLWSRCQFARLPEGYRAEKQQTQGVFYFDPLKTVGGRDG